MSARCPTCDRPLQPDTPRSSRPFCSRRCQLVDLGRWLNENYAIPGTPSEDAVPTTDPDLPGAPER